MVAVKTVPSLKLNSHILQVLYLLPESISGSNESFITKLMKKFITSNILGMDIRSFPWDLGALQNKIAGKLPFYL